MKPLSRTSSVWVLVVILGLTGVSCTTLTANEQRGRVGMAHQESSTVREPDATTKAKVQAAYGQLPLHFEANQGQTGKQVKFLSRGSGYTLFLTSTEAVLALRQQSAVSDQQSAVDIQDLGPRTLDSDLSPQHSVLTLRMKLVGANPNAQVAGLDELPFREGVVSVAMDIEPDREVNFLDCQTTGEMAVGIREVLGLPLPIEVSTLELEGADPQSWVAGDVDGDGEKDDWVVYFEIQGVSDEACQEGITSFFLTGELADGTPIEGSAEVKIVRGW